jgi:glutamyl-tRNA reductase
MSKNRDMVLVGIDHLCPTSQYRERYHLSLKRVAEIYGAGLFGKEMVILSTCNRTEFYLAGYGSEEAIWDALQSIYGPERFDKHHFHLRRGADVIRHLLELASGLQSMIFGETEISGQIDSAVQLAAKNGQPLAILKDLFTKVLGFARRIRVKSGIGTHSTSMTTLMIKTLKKEYNDLAMLRALVLGNGDISQKTATAFHYQGISTTILTRSRRRQPMMILSHVNIVFGYRHLVDLIPAHDVIVAATSAPHLLIRQEHSGLLRGKTMIDLSFPRNIDPVIAHQGSCVFWDLEYFGRISSENRILNEQAAATARSLCYHAAEAINYQLKVEYGERSLVSGV